MSWRLKPDPMGERNPFQVYMLCLAVFSGITVLVSDVPASAGSIESYLSSWEETLWGWFLVVGASASLIGMFWQWDARDSLLIKRFGFAVLSIPLVVYAVVLLGRFGFSALSLSMTITGFTCASFVQAVRVNRQINKVIERTEEHDDDTP